MTFSPPGSVLSHGAGRGRFNSRQRNGKGGRHMVRVILGRGRSALLRRLLVLALVPLVVFSTPGQASAATTYGDAATAEFGARENNVGSAVGSTVSCSVTGYWQAIETVMNVKGRVTCSTGYNVSSALVGFSANGAGCSGSWDPIEMDGAGTRDFIIPMGSAVGSCQVTELCYSIKAGSHTNPWMDDNDSGCVPWAVGGPEEGEAPGSSCTGITLSAPVSSAPFITTVDSSGYQAYVIDTTFEVTADETVPAQDVQIYVTTGNNLNHDPSTTMKTVVGDRKGRTATMAISPGTTTTATVRVGVSYKKSSGTPADPTRSVIASGYWFGPTSGGWANYVGSGQSGSTLGLTRSSPYCTAHWGVKLANTEGDDYDEPIGPQIDSESVPPPSGSETEPDPTPDEPVSDNTCGGFSLTDPSSWAGAGVCAIVKAIQGLISVVAGIPGAILDGLAGLFVPDPSVIEAEVEGVKDAWSDSTVGNYVEPFADADLAVPSGGCAGPSVDFSLRGEDVHWEPLNACSGGMASLASLARLFVTVFVGFFGGLACVRAVGSGFGWRPGVAES